MNRLSVPLLLVTLSAVALAFSTHAPRETTDGGQASEVVYLLKSVRPGYEEHRKTKWLVVHKNPVKKECLFREIDSNTADTLTTAAGTKDKNKKSRGSKPVLMIIDDTNVSAFCDGYATKYL